MSDNSHVNAHRALTAYTADLLKPLVDGGYLTDAGLLYLRGVLREPGVFLPRDPAILRLAYATDVALAERLEMDVSLLPDWSPPDWAAMGIGVP